MTDLEYERIKAEIRLKMARGATPKGSGWTRQGWQTPAGTEPHYGAPKVRAQTSPLEAAELQAKAERDLRYAKAKIAASDPKHGRRRVSPSERRGTAPRQSTHPGDSPETLRWKIVEQRALGNHGCANAMERSLAQAQGRTVRKVERRMGGEVLVVTR